jgi:hypothetical protein
MFTNNKSRVDLSGVLDFDVDGALQETAETAQRHSRRGFLKSSGIALGGAAVAGGLLPTAGVPRVSVLRERAQARRPDG